MPQIYLLTQIYLFLSACIILSDTWGVTYFELSNIRNKVYGSKRLRVALLVTGAVLFVLNVLFPVSPGPIVLGDFIPCINILILEAFFYIKFTKKDFLIDLDKKHDAVGYFTLGVVAVHLLFPQIVLL